jgi:hypothetical protein
MEFKIDGDKYPKHDECLDRYFQQRNYLQNYIIQLQVLG